MEQKRVLDVLNPDFFGLEDDANDVEPVRVTGLLEAGHPDLRRPGELALLPPVDGADGTAEVGRGASLHLDKSDSPAVALRPDGHKVDVATTVPEPSVGNLPTMYREPAGCYLLAFLPHRLPRR